MDSRPPKTLKKLLQIPLSRSRKGNWKKKGNEKIKRKDKIRKNREISIRNIRVEVQNPK